MIWIIQRTWKSCQFFFCLIWLSGCSVLLSPQWLGWFGGRSEASSFDFFQCFELKSIINVFWLHCKKYYLYIAVSSMESSVRLVFLGTDCKRIHKERLYYFSGLNLFFGKCWIFCSLFLFFLFFFVGGVAVI